MHAPGTVEHMHEQHLSARHVEQRRHAAQRRLVESLIHRDDDAHLSLLYTVAPRIKAVASSISGVTMTPSRRYCNEEILSPRWRNNRSHSIVESEPVVV